jgi:hypothetical protein
MFIYDSFASDGLKDLASGPRGMQVKIGGDLL